MGRTLRADSVRMIFHKNYASRKHAPFKNYGNEKVWNTGHGETKHKK